MSGRIESGLGEAGAGLAVPKDHEAPTSIAIRYEGADPTLAENVRQLDAERRPRRPVGEFLFVGRFGSVSKHIA